MWLTLVQIGFVGFIGALCGAVWRGFDADGKRQRTLIWWLLSAALCFALWALSLSRVPAPRTSTISPVLSSR